jgi:hypothetical protein
MARLVDFAKGALSQLLQHFIFADLRAALEAPLQAVLGGRHGECVLSGMRPGAV